MKIYHLPRKPRGFSLFELIAVVALIVGLTAMVVGTLGPVKNLVTRNRCNTLIKKLETGLKAYESEYGGYPINEDIEEGGAVLFRVLTGDFDGDGAPDTANDPDVKPFVTDLVPKLDGSGKPVIDPKTGEPAGSPDAKLVAGQWMVVDPWGNRIYYMNWKRGSAEVPRGGGKHNPTFDLWSLGGDDGSNEAKYIKNW